ncbi:MAG: CxxC-x17-CxxC domain-containing protein [Candidatus Paceibacteria bacterium]|jgi:CxxC-x17-CxxC domain-containing protein
MNNFKGGFKGGDRKFDGKKKFGGDKKYDGGQRNENRGGGSEMFSTTCSECTKKCDVPFKPSQDKPVYCSACFGMKKSGNEQRGSEGHRGQRDRKPFGNGKVNAGPAFSSAPAGPSAQNILELKQQVSALEVKLNKILDLLNPPKAAVKAETAEVAAPAVKAKKVVTKVVTKKIAAKAVPKKVAAKVVKKVAPKKVVKKVTPKKLPAVRVPVKKAVVKAPVKKVAKKAQKAAPKKVVKKVKK